MPLLSFWGRRLQILGDSPQKTIRDSWQLFLQLPPCLTSLTNKLLALIFPLLRGYKSQWVIIKCYFFVWLLHQKDVCVTLGTARTQTLKNSFSHKKQTVLSRQRCPRCCSSAPYSSLLRGERRLNEKNLVPVACHFLKRSWIQGILMLV